MTQEEKARAYDEALERARKMLNMILDNELLGFPDQIREIFPQLRESEDEDERIREGLIEYHKRQFENNRDQEVGLFHKDAIAWLEKQKEQKPWKVGENAYFTPEQKPSDLSEMMVHKEPYIAPVPTPMVADEQKSAEPTGKLSREEYLYQLLIDQLITYSDYEYLTGKNPAWSVEDKAFLKVAIAICNKYSHKDTADWLKSLSERFNLQSKKELSIEKAIQWLDDTFYFLDNSSGRGRDCEITTHDFDSLEEMYNSFRKAVIVDSEPHWKPSDEQMEALKDAVRLFKETHFEKFHYKIESLYEQLEKLYYERGLSA